MSNRTSLFAKYSFLFKVSVGTAATALGLNYYANSVPYTGRHRLFFSLQSVEQKLGAKVEANVMQTSHVLPNNSREVIIAKKVISRILSNFPELQSKTRFVVVNNTVPNAFVAPNGFIVIHSGLFQLMGYDENKLAAVVAHELGHYIARHSGEKLSMSIIPIMLQILMGFSVSLDWLQRLSLLKHSRTMETEADIISLHLLGKNCLPLESSILCQQDLGRINPGSTSYFSTHPSSRDRIQALREKIPEVQDVYAKKCRSAQSFKSSFIHE